MNIIERYISHLNEFVNFEELTESINTINNTPIYSSKFTTVVFETLSNLNKLTSDTNELNQTKYILGKILEYYPAVYLNYKENRMKEYPSIGDQLDALYHAGIFPEEMAAKIKAVKDKYPKPTE